MNFYDSYMYLFHHDMFKDKREYGHFESCVDIYVAKVNPLTNEKEFGDCAYLNTKVEIWLETGEYSEKGMNHDIDLDCGGDTYEEAIIELARLVKENYGDKDKTY